MSAGNKRSLLENDRALGNFWAEENTEKLLLNLDLSQDTCGFSTIKLGRALFVPLLRVGTMWNLGF